MRKQDSKRRWKARIALWAMPPKLNGPMFLRFVPHTAVDLHRLKLPPNWCNQYPLSAWGPCVTVKVERVFYTGATHRRMIDICRFKC